MVYQAITCWSLLNFSWSFRVQTSLSIPAAKTRNVCSPTYTLFFTHCERAMYICIFSLTIIGSDNGLAPWRCHDIIWSNAWILLIGSLETNFCEILIGIKSFSFKKMHFKISSPKWRPFCIGLNMLDESATIFPAYCQLNGVTDQVASVWPTINHPCYPGELNKTNNINTITLHISEKMSTYTSHEVIASQIMMLGMFSLTICGRWPG